METNKPQPAQPEKRLDEKMNEDIPNRGQAYLSDKEAALAKENKLNPTQILDQQTLKDKQQADKEIKEDQAKESKDSKQNKYSFGKAGDDDNKVREDAFVALMQSRQDYFDSQDELAEHEENPHKINYYRDKRTAKLVKFKANRDELVRLLEFDLSS